MQTQDRVGRLGGQQWVAVYVERKPRRRIDVAPVLVERVDGRRVVVAPEVRYLEREAVPTKLHARAELESLWRFPERLGMALAGEADAGETMAPEPEGLAAHQPDRVGLTAATEFERLVVVEVRGNLESHVLERTDVVERVRGARGPQRDARFLE